MFNVVSLFAGIGGICLGKTLNFMGWTVIRFWGKEIMKNTEECIAVIKDLEVSFE